MLLRGRTALAAAVILLAAACGGQAEATPATPPTPGPQPVQSQAVRTMGYDEVQERVDAYLAVAIWAEVSHETAELTPERFHKVMFWKPDVRCVHEFQALREQRPDARYQDLLGCARSRLDQTNGTGWEETSPLEKEARARRALGWMWDGVNPAVYMTANLAFQQAIDVARGIDPAFDTFARSYDECDPPGRHWEKLAQASTPRAMATAWRDALHDTEHCADLVTGKNFPPTGGEWAPGPGEETGPETGPGPDTEQGRDTRRGPEPGAQP